MFAYAEYLPSRQLQNEMLLIRATAGNGSKADAPYISLYENSHLGWDDWTIQPIETCDIPGGHSTMLSDRHARTLAKAMDAFIARSLKPSN